MFEPQAQALGLIESAPSEAQCKVTYISQVAETLQRIRIAATAGIPHENIAAIASAGISALAEGPARSEAEGGQ
jgi:2-keto-3-deoxy-6-phosphogluconate aldolase